MAFDGAAVRREHYEALMVPVVFESFDEFTLDFGLGLGHRGGDTPKVENHRLSGFGADPTASTFRYPHGVDPRYTGVRYQCEQCGRSPVTDPRLLTGLGSDPGQQMRVNPGMLGGVCAGGVASADVEGNGDPTVTIPPHRNPL
ncbi:hypothetical protein ACFTZB_24855 [Rhodococcus sp. NPDC057014]|uniref:hypothetical protein n=1 Tax=Rhodococcus sp. NPDC057014 TaxID=3346000 RepID=UPI00363069B4